MTADLRSYRVLDAFRELRIARRLGRRLTSEEAARIPASSGFDSLQLREIVLRRFSGRLVKMRYGCCKPHRYYLLAVPL